MTEPIELELKCMIHTVLDEEFEITSRLQKGIPALSWTDGDSSWDKVRVWTQTADLFVRIYRYESPGPFELTVRIRAAGRAAAEERYAAIRGQVLAALDATL